MENSFAKIFRKIVLQKYFRKIVLQKYFRKIVLHQLGGWALPWKGSSIWLPRVTLTSSTTQIHSRFPSCTFSLQIQIPKDENKGQLHTASTQISQPQSIQNFTSEFKSTKVLIESVRADISIPTQPNPTHLGKNHGTISAVQMDFVQIAF